MKDDYFYHIGYWIDMNNDGRLDFLTARTKASAGTGELVYLENPEEGLKATPWKLHHVVDGPSVYFDVEEIDGNPETIDIFAAEFFDKRVKLYIINSKTLEVEKNILIESNVGQAYECVIADINGDGKPDLLAGNHERKTQNTKVWAYEIPDDIEDTAGYVRHDLAGNFPVAFSIIGSNMAPGFLYPVYPRAGGGNTRPYILIAGDGDHTVSLLVPTGDAWKYEHKVLKKEGGTVGSLAVQDIDGDGFYEFLVANYDSGYVELWKFEDIEKNFL